MAEYYFMVEADSLFLLHQMKDLDSLLVLIVCTDLL